MSIDYSSFTGTITVCEIGKITEVKKEKKSFPPGLLRQTEIIKKYGCTQNQIASYTRRGLFPKPISYSERIASSKKLPLYCPKAVKAFFDKK